MKKDIIFFLLMLVICSVTLLHSCDTPQSIAWSYYHCAEDKLNLGDPYAAKDFLDRCNANRDKVLALKADSLMRVIEKAIEEDRLLKRVK